MGINDITLTNVISVAVSVSVGIALANQSIKWLIGRITKEESKTETMDSKMNTAVTGIAVMTQIISGIQSDLADVKKSVDKINDLYVNHTELSGRVKAIEDRFNDHIKGHK